MLWVRTIVFSFTFSNSFLFSLAVNRKMIDAAMLAFHEQMEIDFKKLESQILPFLVGKLSQTTEKDQ